MPVTVILRVLLDVIYIYRISFKLIHSIIRF